MAKKFLQKYLPHPDTITGNRWIKLLGPRLQDKSLWHMNRRSCSGALAVGLFCAFIPVPFQMLLAAVAAIAFRVNILIAVPTVWISNPVTMPPIFYFCYLVGAAVLETPHQEFNFELSFEWLLSGLLHIWQPFLLGCFIVGSISAITALVLTRILWRMHIISYIKAKRERRRARKST